MNSTRNPRRKFLLTGATGVLTTIFGSLPKPGLSQSFSADDKAIVVREEEGIHILTRRKVPITIKISKKKYGVDNISFCVEEMIPGRKMRVHKHLYNDELIFIHKGEGTLTLDEELVEAKTGDVIFVPGGYGMGWTIREKKI